MSVVSGLPKLKAVVFDHNGTMLDDLHLSYGAAETIFKTLNLPCPTKGQYREEIGSDYMAFYRRHGVPGNVSADEINVIRSLYYNARMGQAKFRPDLVPALKYCESLGLQLAVCSAEIASVLHAFLERDHLVPYFKMIRADASAKTAALTEIATSAGIAPEQVAFVDDSVAGIGAARRAGLQAIAFAHQTGYNSSQRLWAANPDHVVVDFNELRRLIGKLVA